MNETAQSTETQTYEEHTFANAGELAQALADDVAETLQAATAERGQASMLVPGGKTPVPFFRKLNLKELDWQTITIGLTDERWVPTNSADSNERLVREELIGTHPANMIGLKIDSSSPDRADRICERVMSRVPVPYDVVVVGMGDDGHIASLFPGGRDIERAVRPQGPHHCTPAHAPVAPHRRLSLTVPALLLCRRLILLITGDDKQAVLERAKAPGPVEDMPVRALLRQDRVPLEVYWSP